MQTEVRVVDTRYPDHPRELLASLKPNKNWDKFLAYLTSFSQRTERQVLDGIADVFDWSFGLSAEEVFDRLSADELTKRIESWEYLYQTLIKEDILGEEDDERIVSYNDNIVQDLATLCEITFEEAKAFLENYGKENEILFKFGKKFSLSYEIITCLNARESKRTRTRFDRDAFVYTNRHTPFNDGDHAERDCDIYWLICNIKGVFYGGIMCYYLPGTDYLRIRLICKSWAGIFAEIFWGSNFPKLNSLLIPEIEMIARNVGANRIYVNPYPRQAKILKTYYGFRVVTREEINHYKAEYLNLEPDSGTRETLVKELVEYEGDI